MVFACPLFSSTDKLSVLKPPKSHSCSLSNQAKKDEKEADKELAGSLEDTNSVSLSEAQSHASPN